MKLFGGDKSDHPLADAKEARKILDAIPAGDPFKALEDLNHWLESVRTWENFKPEHRAQTVQMVDEAAQAHLRKLQREYLSSSRLSKFQENRMWAAIRESYRQSAIAFATCVDHYATGKKGWEDLKQSMPLLTVRALLALAAQMKWQYVRYGPPDAPLWEMIGKIFALAENRKYAQAKVVAYPGVAGETSTEQEFLKVLTLAASSPDSLLPVEIDLAERLIAHLAGSFKLASSPQPDTVYCFDLANREPPVRLVHLPHRAPTLRYFAAAGAMKEIEKLIQAVKSTNAVPSHLGLGGSDEPEVVLDVLNHLALYWSSQPPERKAPRHRVKSRLAVTFGFDGVLAALDPSGEIPFDESKVETWIVENVSAGGFGASVPQIKGDGLKIGCLLGLQPEGGTNWVVGIIRRFQRESPQQGTVGIQTLARAALPVQVKLQSGQMGTSKDAETAILLNPLDGAAEAQLLLRSAVLLEGQNLELQRNGQLRLLLPIGVKELGEDYELVRFRQMIRDTRE
ncbi:MAG TPA: hypothetical protein VIW78_01115 [Burkholderiales bacterium]